MSCGRDLKIIFLIYERIVTMLCAVGFSFMLHSQNLTISGGSEHSVMICGKGLVYAWGNNKNTTQGWNNLLGLKDPAQAAAAFVMKPTEVQLPAGVTFKQVDAGSGDFNIALGCNNVVYMWGGNSH
jgi:alpha-tubulin suppressor-like RCC1 family protein